MNNWVYQHDMNILARNIGKYFTGYLEFTPQEGKKATVSEDCPKCQRPQPLFIPKSEKKEWFRKQMKAACIGAPSTLSPLFNHFWFHARCSSCGEDLVLMRS